MKALLTCCALMASAAADAGEPTPATDIEKASYAIGVDIARNFKRQSVEIDCQALARGMRDVVSGQLAMTDDEMRQAIAKLQAQMRDRAKMAGELNRKQGEEFLAANGKRGGVTVLPSGLQYEVVAAGTGPKPAPADTVEVHYCGRLIDGTGFDNSYRRQAPAKFRVTGVIRGWTEALQLMSVGAKWKLFIPSDLAYGAQGQGRDIGPNCTLIFDVELLGIEHGK